MRWVLFFRSAHKQHGMPGLQVALGLCLQLSWLHSPSQRLRLRQICLQAMRLRRLPAAHLPEARRLDAGANAKAHNLVAGQDSW